MAAGAACYLVAVTIPAIHPNLAQGLTAVAGPLQVGSQALVLLQLVGAELVDGRWAN
jgi:hypothetical protein